MHLDSKMPVPFPLCISMHPLTTKLPDPSPILRSQAHIHAYVICTQESRLNPHVVDELVFTEDFVAYRQDRQSNASKTEGGVVTNSVWSSNSAPVYLHSLSGIGCLVTQLFST